MACQPRKDESKLIAKTRISPLELKHCVYVYLWADKESMWSVTTEHGCDACACNMPFMQMSAHTPLQELVRKLTFGLIGHGVEFRRFSRKIAELHFVVGKWDEETVSHECLHAALSLARAYGLSCCTVFDGQHSLSECCYELLAGHEELQHITSDEELLCYIQGELNSHVFRWLWRSDPKPGWKKVDE